MNYIPGETNTLSDALSHIYSAELVGTTHAENKYVSKDDDDSKDESLLQASCPIFTGAMAIIPSKHDTPNLHQSACLAKPTSDKQKFTGPEGMQPPAIPTASAPH